MQGGQKRTAILVAWVDWWVDEKVTARSSARLLRGLSIDFTEEKYGGGGRI
tara:strand:- start:105 stop:257 length:153 start_codon:yes stop_codon:yes gene_type:complete